MLRLYPNKKPLLVNRIPKTVSFFLFFWVVFGCIVEAAESSSPRKTENVLLVMTDGFRWQEVFAGAEETLLNKKNGGVENVKELKKSFWRETPAERRESLLPFVWGVMAKQGQLFGNRGKGSEMQVSNGLKFSYPGYNETLCGFPDPRIDRNDAGPNPNITVFEWLHRKPAYGGRVAAFGAWDAFDDIFNRNRCGFYVNSAFAPMAAGPDSPEVRLLNRLREDEPRLWEGEPADAITFYSALEYFKEHKPRAFFLSLGETDEWAHSGRYDQYLQAARRADKFVKILWDTAQSMPEYRGKTALVFTADHGRGDAPTAWKNHGKDVAGSENTWLAILGPDTPVLGERTHVPAVTNGQIAATLAALLGEDYCKAVPRAAKPITDVLPADK